jgi:hypothetical protein
MVVILVIVLREQNRDITMWGFRTLCWVEYLLLFCYQIRLATQKSVYPILPLCILLESSPEVFPFQ